MTTKNKAPKEVDYDVGYQKPPAHSRFKPGRSGNPKGRPKGTNNLKTDLAEELGERITVREGGNTKTVSKQRAFLKALMNKALRGDVRAASLAYTMMMRLLDTGETATGYEIEMTNDDYEVLETFLQQRREDETPAEETSK